MKKMMLLLLAGCFLLYMIPCASTSLWIQHIIRQCNAPEASFDRLSDYFDSEETYAALRYSETGGRSLTNPNMELEILFPLTHVGLGRAQSRTLITCIVYDTVEGKRQTVTGISKLPVDIVMGWHQGHWRIIKVVNRMFTSFDYDQ